MSAIVAKFRKLAHDFRNGPCNPDYYAEAADEIEKLQADAARWQHVRKRLAAQNLMGTWHFISIRAPQDYRESLDEAMDRLIEAAKREGR